MVQETDQLKLELQDIEKEMKNTDDQIAAVKDKITNEEKQLEQLTQAADTAKVTRNTSSHIDLQTPAVDLVLGVYHLDM